MTYTDQNVQMPAGETRVLNYTIDDPDGGLDLTAAQAIEWEASDGDTTITKTLANGGLTATGALTCTVTLSSGDTTGLAANNLTYSLWVTDSGGDRSKLASGVVSVGR